MPAVSRKQRRFMGIVRGMKAKKTPKSYSKKEAKAAESMSLKAVKHFAKTKERGLPFRTKKENNPGPVASNSTQENPFSFRDVIKKIRKRKKKTDEIMKELFPEETKKG